MKRERRITGRNKRWRRASVAVFFVAAAWLVSWGAASWLIVEAPLAHADAIVILSGSSTYFERAETAASLFKEGRADKIILTNDNRQGGWSNVEQRNPFFFERTKAELERQGVPQTRVEVIMEPVYSTHDEALRLLDFSSKRRFSALLVVTSPYHSRRALSTFRQTFSGSNIQIGIAHPPTGLQSPTRAAWWLHFRGWQMVPYEYLKLVYYWLRG